MHEVVKKLIENEYAAQRSEEWLKLRGNMLTASDAATATGDNPYETVNDLILKKCGYNKFTGNKFTEHGNKYEDEARDLYCKERNEVCHEIGLHPHPDYSWLGGSPDGITESGKLVEIKCPLMRKIKDEVPGHYLPQLQLLMEILNLEECDFIQYKPYDLTWPKPMEFVITNVKRDRQWFENKLPLMKECWEKVIWHRKNGVENLIAKPKTTKTIKTKKTSSKQKQPMCEIVECDDDLVFNEY